jgi:uncharacterized protein YuzE
VHDSVVRPLFPDIIESEEVRPGVILDFDENDQVVGVEFLHVSERASSADLSVMQFEHS